jgi:hypothetical protein
LFKQAVRPIFVPRASFKENNVRFLTAALWIALTVLALPVPSHAEETRFFEALYDVPAMPGLVETTDQTMVFDKPDGKIALVTAQAKSKTQAQVEGFYAEVLPQLGWKKTKQNHYVRDGETLVMTFSPLQGGIGVQFSLSPVR